MTYPVNVMQGSEIEVTEDREAVLDCVSPGGKPAPDVSVFHLDTFFAPFFVAIFVSLFCHFCLIFCFFGLAVSHKGASLHLI